VLLWLLRELDLDTVVQGCGNLIDVLHVGRQQGVEVYSLSPGDGHARSPVAKMPCYAHHLRMNALGQLNFYPYLHYRGFQPHLIAVSDPLCPGCICIDKDAVSVRITLTELVDAPR